MGTIVFSGSNQYTQDSRPIRIDTSLGKDVLLLRHFKGQEGYSQLFQYEVDVLSYRGDIKAEEVVGEHICITVGATTDTPRMFSGYINYFEYTGLESRGLYGYKAVLVPWLWFLSKSTDCRVFQRMTVPQILESVFSDLGFANFKLSGLNNRYPELEYCVQYRESDLNFVLRLMEQEGIYFYFEQNENKHTLLLADDKSSSFILEPAVLEHSSGSRKEETIQQWKRSFQYFSGKWCLSDYNFEKFDKLLQAECSALVSLKGNSQLERYDYPGTFIEQDRGSSLTKLRMELEESGFTKASGKSNVTSVFIGRKFTLHSDECSADTHKNFVITRLYHQATEGSYLEQSEEGDAYFNEFECIPDNVNFRPPLITSKPKIDGVQTAVVCGKTGDEIYTDQYGRIKVQFHWDRYGKKNEESSCWVRVATQWAGKKWGAVGIPRVGQEVVVTFLEGDPDRPMVIGSVYNRGHMPPYTLPGEKTKSGIKSRSSKGGQSSNYNEIAFDDKVGAELISIHAEKDLNTNVKNNVSTDTKGNSTTKVAGNSSDSVEGNKSLSVSKDHSVSVSGNQNVSVTGKQTISVTGNQTVNVSADQEESVSGNIKLSTTNQTLDISSDQTINATNQKITLGAAQEVTASSQKFTIGGSQNVQAEDQDVTITGKTMTTATEIILSAANKISLTVGKTSIQIDSNGVTISTGSSSVKVDVADVSVSGPMIKLN